MIPAPGFATVLHETDRAHGGRRQEGDRIMSDDLITLISGGRRKGVIDLDDMPVRIEHQHWPTAVVDGLQEKAVLFPLRDLR